MLAPPILLHILSSRGVSGEVVIQGQAYPVVRVTPLLPRALRWPEC